MTKDYCCKLGRVADQYDLTGGPNVDSLDEALLARWQGTGGFSEHGYRTLTDWFNERLLERAYERAGRRVSDTQLDAEFEVLLGDDELKKLDLEDELAEAGVDAEGVRGDMISWSTMRVHLTECLEGEKKRVARTDWERNSIEIARSQAATKIEEAVDSLGSKGRVTGAEAAAVSIDVQLHCDQCEASVPLVVAVDRGYVCEKHHKETDS
ncbi:MAG: rod-determining factor RdfA [Natrinema limicola]